MATLSLDFLFRDHGMARGLGEVAKKSDDAKRALDNVAKATTQLESAQQKAKNATGQLRVAEAELEALRKRKGASTVQMVRAEERLAAAQRDVAASEKDLAAAAKRLDHNKEAREIARKAAEGGGHESGPPGPPTGYAVFAADNTIRSLADPTGQIAHWSEFDRGGHFPAMEVPDLLVGDVRRFFDTLR